MPEDPELRGLLWFLLGGTRGGENRARIISKIRDRPWNMNQLAKRLGVEYRTIQHHIEVLKKNSIVDSAGEHYGLTYFLTPWLEAHLDIFDEITKKLNIKFGSSPKQSGKDL